MVGIVLGNVAVEYSIKWSIVLHIINNGIFVDLLSFLTKDFSETAQNIVYGTILIGFFVASVVILIRYRKEIANYFKKKEPGKCGYVLTSVGTILYFVITIAAACSCITTC